jgi:hypothetical protein
VLDSFEFGLQALIAGLEQALSPTRADLETRTLFKSSD